MMADAAATEEGNNDTIEVFLPADQNENEQQQGVHNGIIMADLHTSSPSKRDAAKRRWRLLRTVNRAQNIMRNSLRKEERELLDRLQKDKDASQRSLLHEDDHCDERVELTNFLQENQDRIPSKEAEYLQSLIQSKHVSSLTIRKARHSIVLTEAPLRREDYPTMESVTEDAEEAQEPADATKEEVEEERPTLVRNDDKSDASFRKEMWKWKSERISQRKAEKQRKQSERATKQTESVTSQEPGSSFLGFLFGGGSSKKEEKEAELSDNDDDDDDDDEDLVEYPVLGTHAEDDNCFPHVLTPVVMDKLRQHLPYVVRCDNFWLKYSLIRDGASMRALCDCVRNSARTLLAIETMQGDLIGCFTSSPWTPHGSNYFGSGEAFLWRMQNSRYTPCSSVDEQAKLESSVDVYMWSGQNRNVQRLERTEGTPLILGGGGPDEDAADPDVNVDDSQCGSGLVLMADLENGFSNPCLTFKSPTLPPSEKEESFDIANIEVWTLTPVETVDQAEQVELGRRFIFDNSHFVES